MSSPLVNDSIVPRVHRLALAVCLAVATTSLRVGAQVSVGGRVSAIGLLSRDTDTPGGRTLTEGYLSQPLIRGSLDASFFHAIGLLDLEALTLRRGELDLGEWGEGYVDRRHPHAFVHELMTGVETERGRSAMSLYTGRGFVSFGSDDPMVRPFVSYPVDHHLAQVLERLVAVGATRMGAFIAEASVFNGDEPLNPSTPPRFDRFGDSWAVRGTLVGGRMADALRGAELSASYAAVKSPEYRDGHGLDQRKLHVGLRLTGHSGALEHSGLLEAARTTELDRGRSLYTFRALLAEGSVCRYDLGAALRWERSDRPEEERLLDLFRSPRPATDVSILGVTQWTTLTGALSLPAIRTGPAHAAPFIELARLTVDRTSAALFDPSRFYGATAMWRLDAGVRFGVGGGHARMGRYGAAAGSMPSMAHHAGSTGQASERCFT